MPPKGKNWVKPGLAANIAYEKQRANTIDENNKRLNALGLKRLATSVISSAQPKCTIKKGKKVKDTGYDDEYRPSDGEDDDDDDDSCDSLVHEDIEMPPRKRLNCLDPLIPEPVQKVDPTAEGGNQTVHEMHFQQVDMQETPLDRGSLDANEMVSPPSEPHSSSVGSTARRGQTRGIRTALLIEKNGKLPVPIPAVYRQPVGKYANSFASTSGAQLREHLSNPGVRRWSNVPPTSTGPIIQRLTDKFDLQGDAIDVKKAVDAKLGRQLSDWTHRLYKKYLMLKSDKNEDYIRINPPKNCTLEQWTHLIDHKWNDPKFQHQSAINTANRALLDTNHTCGSKSMAVRANEFEEKNQGKPIELTDFFQSTHYNDKKKKWATPACERKYEALKKTQEDHYSQSDAPLLTAEDLSIQVLGTRSGRLKGLGRRPSSSFRSTIASSQNNENSRHLEERVQQLEAQNQSQAEEMAEQTRQMAEQNRQMAEKLAENNRQMESMFAVLRMMGHDLGGGLIWCWWGFLIQCGRG